MEEFRMVILAFTTLMCVCHCFHLAPMPCNVSLTDTCPASLYFIPSKPKTIEETTSLFHVNPNVVTKAGDGFLISINCSCPADHDEFVWHTNYLIQPGDTWENISMVFGSMVLERPAKQLIVSQTVMLDLLCGCSDGVRMVTYVVEAGDTLFTICNNFGCDVEKTKMLNKVDDSALIHVGDILFIPTTDLGHILLDDKDPKFSKTLKPHSHLVVVIIGAVVAIMFVLTALTALLVWLYCYKRKETGRSDASAGGIKCSPFFFASSIFNTSASISLQDLHSSSKESGTSAISMFSSDKATVFQYYEVCDATSNFSASRKLGQGSYGSVYLGRLKGTEVAVKQMKNTKSKEFLAELNILCKVHHKNLIELIGYAAGGDYLFLVYEFAENGALSEHLHCPSIKGHAPLSWTARVQIALDAAKGLEYIHVHTKPYYVHRDVKTSNILLDSSFRAKIADFGLVKLLEHSPEIGTATSKIVGTFGYLAPEYVRDGCVTTKSDVYAYGVVLMELITGRPALSRSLCTENNLYSEHRSVIGFMLSALEDNEDPAAKLLQCIDPNLTHYHKNSLVQMALLAKDCVDDDRNQRPDMSKVAICLSHILDSSKEWEVQGQNHPHS
ncbi:lysM domain receptor-like kinase 3 [Magnolia sinica]|uniref:lysM domain receptor-like kinase 3 n=1 Tax=Magnolia sinica TaxID=86752 RepID=UPI00265ABA0D|nr:lysM domain receptor-like kinase 3 [Magnolia sinica]